MAGYRSYRRWGVVNRELGIENRRILSMYTENFSREIRWLLDEKYKGMKTPEAEKDIERLRGGEPVAYVIGFVNFCGSRIDLSLKPMIPRLETEYWVSMAIQEIKEAKHTPSSFLDIFSGSGCIGLALARNFPEASIDFAEKNPDFVLQIQMNAEKNAINIGRYTIIQSDVFGNISGTYDAIFANPPYIAEPQKENVEKSVLENEPHEALFAPDGGLYYIKQVIRELPRHLNNGGVLYLEFDSQQSADVQALAMESHLSDVDMRRDQYGEWRWARLIK